MLRYARKGTRFIKTDNIKISLSTVCSSNVMTAKELELSNKTLPQVRKYDCTCPTLRTQFLTILKKENCICTEWRYVLQLHQIHKHWFCNYSKYENMCGASRGWAQTTKSLSTIKTSQDDYSKLCITSSDVTKCNQTYCS